MRKKRWNEASLQWVNIGRLPHGERQSSGLSAGGTVISCGHFEGPTKELKDS